MVTEGWPQASQDPLWPLSFVCHFLVRPVQYFVYIWSWHQASEGQVYHSFILDPIGTTITENKICDNILDTHAPGDFARLWKHIEPQRLYPDLGFADVHLKSLSFHVGLPEDQLLLQLLQRFSDDDQIIYIQLFLCETIGRGLPRAGWTVRILDESLGEQRNDSWVFYNFAQVRPVNGLGPGTWNIVATRKICSSEIFRSNLRIMLLIRSWWMLYSIIIHGTKHRTDNQLQSLEFPCRTLVENLNMT